MLARVLRTIEERALLRQGERVLVGLSGGPDSTALLRVLAGLRPRLGLHVEAACVDHGLRAGSPEEARQVAARSQAAGLPCAVLSVDVRARRGPHVSWQDAARRARHAALEAHAATVGCSRIALGHTADDQAETILFRIVRGTGVVGLAGIPYARGPFVRPLLDVRRAEILRYVARHDLATVEDPSNADPRYTRVRVRREWLPLLARENPRVVEALLALAEDVRQQGGPEARAAPALAPPGTPRRTAAVIRRLLTDGKGTRRVSLPGGQPLELRYGRILGPEDVWPGPGPEDRPELPVAGPGRFRWSGAPAGAPGLELTMEGGEGGEPAGQGAVFDADALAWPLCLRPLRPGDRLWPRGGPGRRKLQDLLVDAKVPRPERPWLPVLVGAEGTVLYVPGLRPAQQGRPTPATTRRLRVRPWDAG